MATEHRTVIQVGLKGLPEARRALEGLRLELQERLMERYGSRLGVEVGDITDAAEVAELLEATETTEACASLHICLNRGWREGASLLIRWDSKDPARLVVSTSASSRLEAQTIAWVTGSPAAALAAYRFFFIDRRWISVALGAMVGILVGMGLYCVLARPILALAAGRQGKTSEAIARELHPLAVKWVREGRSVPVVVLGSGPSVSQRSVAANPA